MLGSETYSLMASYFGTKSGMEPPQKSQVIFEQSPCPLGGTMKHENRGADFSPKGTYRLVCWQASL
jgi:hypothetical protein